MFKSLFQFLYKTLEMINNNTNVALQNLRQHLYFMDFEDRSDDVYVVTYAKAGTTWLQVILHNLLTNGNMDFDHIYDVSPWPQNEAFNGESAERINKLPSPRILKSHDKYDFYNSTSKNKFIYLYRDGKDVAVSLYFHNKNYVDANLTFNTNFQEFFLDDSYYLNWFKFNNEWFQNKNRFRILYISYEELITHFDNTIEKIASYLNVELTSEIITRINTHASFGYMKKHEEKFGKRKPKSSELVYNQFIRNGKIGEGNNYLNKQELEEYNKRYDKFIEPYLSKIKI